MFALRCNLRRFALKNRNAPMLFRLAPFSTTPSSTSNSNNNNNNNTIPSSSSSSNSANDNSEKSKTNNSQQQQNATDRETERLNTEKRQQAREYFWRVQRERNQAIAFKVGAVVLVTLCLSYAFVPLYQAFCQATGYGGTTQAGKKSADVLAAPESAKKAKPITIYFNADTSQNLKWKFEPSQRSVQCNTGESVLAFFRATNLTDKPIVGISTYNVTPMKAGLYFHKIQCFCFDEQRLRPHETVEMPVLFYIDPDIDSDKNTKDITDLVLSYTFFLVDTETGEPEAAFDRENAKQH